MLNLYNLIRPILFSLDPELAHELSLKFLKYIHQIRAINFLFSNETYPINLGGLNLKNPIGLAAGMDKNGAYIDALGCLGFGFIEIGTVTRFKQVGNEKPRLFRLPNEQALINRLGFNNDGVDQLINNVENSRWRDNGGILGINIGKSFDTPIDRASEDYVYLLDRVYQHADYIVLNVSSPNTQNLRKLESSSQGLDQLLKKIQSRRLYLAEKHGILVPIFLKISPDLSKSELDALCNVFIKNEINGIISTNTTIFREEVKNRSKPGGLSGLPLHNKSLATIKILRENLGKSIPIIGCGGILGRKQVEEKLMAGANAIQLYTGLIYRGPVLIKECITEFLRFTSENR